MSKRVGHASLWFWRLKIFPCDFIGEVAGTVIIIIVI